MQPPQHRLRLLARLARLREVEAHKAARHLAQTELTRQQLQALRQRSGDIAALYQQRRDAQTGADLRTQKAFISGLNRIAEETAGQHASLLPFHRQAQQALGEARAKHERVADRLVQQQLQISDAQFAADAAPAARLARKLKS
ncbi:hypothetical protein [Erythrobacter sp. EC-HK427]|uniref:hypothetical protein n=1 Tax=Erythrobacter sp. EC-HK427 TaxID=2038396 RepID=UPI0012552DBE|nr:hypothetical protein [Erythrobacter sp. EC-HK427]VVT01685.1 conserved hypothetical protein [Erythrobacter sp. EC-HK427]